MSFCKDCATGVTHEGVAQGKWEKIGGVDSYVATPTVDYPKDKVLLFLPDIFGAQLDNAQLLADDFARCGFKTVIPDYLNGDPVGADAMNTGFDIGAWFPNHTQEKTRPTLDKVIAALKAQGVTGFGTTAYCFGARYTFDLAFEGITTANVVSHPSLLTLEDFDKYHSISKAPLLINSCTHDPQFTPELQAKADKVLGGGNFAPGYKREFWEGCTHGFAVRGDLSDPKVKAGKEGSFKAAVEWLLAHL